MSELDLNSGFNEGYHAAEKQYKSQIESLQSQLDEIVSALDRANQAIGNEHVQYSQAQRINYLDMGRAYYMRRYDEVIEERDKLQYVVGEMRKALEPLSELWETEELNPKLLKHDCAEEKWMQPSECANAKAAIDLTPDSLPPLYTEEQFKELCNKVAKSTGLNPEWIFVQRKYDDDFVAPKLYTEEEVRPLVEFIQIVSEMFYNVSNEDMRRNYKDMIHKSTDLLSTFQRKERG